MSKRKYTDDDFIIAVRNSVSIAGTLRKIGLVPEGGNYSLAKTRIRELGLNTSHFTGQGHLKGKSHGWAKKIPLSEVMVEDSKYKRISSLRERLIRAGVFDRICQSCGNTHWMGKPIPLELHHINGVNTDNRRENLKLLCPNCHAFTPTYRGRNTNETSILVKEIWTCKKCGKILKEKRMTGMCGSCRDRRSAVIPHSLTDDIKTLGIRGTSRKYGVSAPTITKWKNATVAQLAGGISLKN